MTAPLEGLLVVAIDQAVAAPFATSRLADAGARVIKVERPSGDFARRYDTMAGGESAYFVWLNRGKESIELDIKDTEDAALLHRMIDRADVFVQNLAPGAAARAGFGAEALRARRPGLICCDISGYGTDGPYRDMKAYDLLIQAETGLASVTGGPEAPGRVGVSVADIGAGLYAYNGILQALLRRERTGEGAWIKVSLFDAVADWMAVPLLQHTHTGRGPERIGLAHPGIAPYGAFATSDGRQVVIAIQNEREWRWLCRDILGDEILADDPRFHDNEARVANRPALDGMIAAVIGPLDRDTAMARLRAAGIACGALNSVTDLAAHPQLRLSSVETPSGRVSMPAPPAQFEDEPVAALRPAPALGEHAEAIRAEFGAEASAEAMRRRQDDGLSRHK